MTTRWFRFNHFPIKKFCFLILWSEEWDPRLRPKNVTTFIISHHKWNCLWRRGSFGVLHVLTIWKTLDSGDPFHSFKKVANVFLCPVKSISNMSNPPYEEPCQGHFHKMIIWGNLNIQCICIFNKNMNMRSVEKIQQIRCLLTHSCPGFQTPIKTPVSPIWIPALRVSRKSWDRWGLAPQNLKQEFLKNEGSSAFPLSNNSLQHRNWYLPKFPQTKPLSQVRVRANSDTVRFDSSKHGVFLYLLFIHLPPASVTKKHYV